MFSLIITIISIALVAALALATLYYGGDAFKRGAASADATKLYVQAQQLQGAAELYKADTGAYPLTMEVMLTGNYLKSIPVSSLTPNLNPAQETGNSPTLMAQASAAGVVWKMVLSGQPVFAMTQVSVAVCEAVNMKAYGISGILKSARSTYSTQCFGTDLASLTMVTTKSGAALVTASVSPLATVSLGTVLTTAPPAVNSGDTTAAGWLTVEGVTVAAVTPPVEPTVPVVVAPVLANTIILRQGATTLGAIDSTPATLNPTALVFDIEALLTGTVTRTVTLTNPQSVPVTIDNIQIGNPPENDIAAILSGAGSCQRVLLAGQSCDFNIVASAVRLPMGWLSQSLVIEGYFGADGSPEQVWLNGGEYSIAYGGLESDTVHAGQVSGNNVIDFTLLNAAGTSHTIRYQQDTYYQADEITGDNIAERKRVLINGSVIADIVGSYGGMGVLLKFSPTGARILIDTIAAQDTVADGAAPNGYKLRSFPVSLPVGFVPVSGTAAFVY